MISVRSHTRVQIERWIDSFYRQWPECRWASQQAEKEKCHLQVVTPLKQRHWKCLPLNFTFFLPPSPSRNSFLETTSFLTLETSRQCRLQMVKDNELEGDERSRQTHGIIPQLFLGLPGMSMWLAQHVHKYA